MSEHRFYDESDPLYVKGREVVLDACSQLGELDDLRGIPTAALLTYLTIDEDGQEWTGHFYVGGLNSAIGLASRAHNKLLAQDIDEEDDE